MSNLTIKAATLSTHHSLAPIVEKKLASGVRHEIETAMLFANRLVRMANTKQELEAAHELVEKTETALEIFKLVTLQH